MAYGIQVYNAGGNVLIDSQAQTQMAVSDTGNVAAASVFKNNNEIIMFKRSGSGHLALSSSYGSSNIYCAATANWIKVSEIKSVSPPAQGAYGITIFDAGGTSTKTYADSFGNGFTMVSVFPTGTITGNDVIYTGSTANIYFGGGKPFYNFTVNGGSAWNNAYYTANSIEFVNYTTNNITGTLHFTNGGPIFLAEIR